MMPSKERQPTDLDILIAGWEVSLARIEKRFTSSIVSDNVRKFQIEMAERILSDLRALKAKSPDTHKPIVKTLTGFVTRVFDNGSDSVPIEIKGDTYTLSGKVATKTGSLTMTATLERISGMLEKDPPHQ